MHGFAAASCSENVGGGSAGISTLTALVATCSWQTVWYLAAITSACDWLKP